MLSRRMVASGHVLFRWRSFVLFAFLPVFVWAVWDGKIIEQSFGSAASLLVDTLGFALIAVGELIRIGTVGFVPRNTSGRNTDKGQLAERLNTTGLYSLMRNPLYLGNCMMYVGLAVLTQHLWFAVVLALFLVIYYERIICAEEDFLQGKFGAPYLEWAQKVPPFFPRLHGWEKPDMDFSLRTVIRREHASILGGFVGVYLVLLGLHSLPANAQPMPEVWHWIIGTVVAVDVIVVALKKLTNVFAVEGR